MIKNTLKKISLFTLIAFFFSACGSEKNLKYFASPPGRQDTVTIAKAYIPRIQPGDILSIYVNSLSPEASSFFNPYTGTSSMAGGSSPSSSAGAGQMTQPGYLVDPSGEIELPLIGNVKVSEYTTTQVRDTLKKLLSVYLKEPTVLVRFLNFKISILGEVARPDVYNIPNEMITLPEAISMAGDLTLYARRDSIEIIRDVNGKKVFANVDFSKRDVFSSPYYYLHSNDIVYVKPAKTKTQQTDRTIQYVSIAATLISLILVIFRR
ncbi:polysaccharide biosynthesis/export family protein [Mucilaginibacter sp. L196]|uniref:polysaccharide biosynthesis/export family protein n=1 Tax=Mucilaginibacter sp. L196 TaxID=1641870 RepID=UPI00131A8E31|nr:polysaccharide biosynthesis/export family protein [Mucilaginibacter sp. L196]